MAAASIPCKAQNRLPGSKVTSWDKCLLAIQAVQLRKSAERDRDERRRGDNRLGAELPPGEPDHRDLQEFRRADGG